MLSGTAPALAQMSAASGTQLHQFALTQINVALEYLTNPAHEQNKAIHETRRCIKRIRAILRLVKTDLSETIFDRDNIYLRNIGRSLSALRDQAAALAALKNLQEQGHPQLTERAWQNVQKALMAHSLVSPADKQKIIQAAIKKLKVVQQRIQRWDCTAVSETTIQNGLRKTYKKGRQTLAQVRIKTDVENLHEWRKHVNQLRHQLNILHSLALIKKNASKDEYKKLATILGDNNDLATLTNSLTPLLSKVPAKQRTTLCQLIAAQQAALTAQALQYGQEIYSAKAKVVMQRLWL